MNHQHAPADIDQGRVERQHDITRCCAVCAQMLMQYGAETALADDLSTRLGLALGAHRVENLFTPNAAVITTIIADHCITTARKCPGRGINMHMIFEVQQIVIAAEHGQLSLEQVQQHLSNIPPLRHHNWLVVLMVGLGCACFCRLASGSLGSTLLTWVMGSMAMLIRQRLSIAHIHPLVNICITAFATTFVCGFTLRFIPVETPTIAMASCILLLVPGFPLINAVADIFKGYTNTGIARWVIASMFALATCIGVVFALSLMGAPSWS